MVKRSKEPGETREKVGPGSQARGGSPPLVGPGPQARGGSPPLKERVIHTRVPALLEEELKRFAENLRMPVSNLVRAILEDARSAGIGVVSVTETLSPSRATFQGWQTRQLRALAASLAASTGR